VSGQPQRDAAAAVASHDLELRTADPLQVLRQRDGRLPKGIRRVRRDDNRLPGRAVASDLDGFRRRREGRQQTEDKQQKHGKTASEHGFHAS